MLSKQLNRKPLNPKPPNPSTLAPKPLNSVPGELMSAGSWHASHGDRGSMVVFIGVGLDKDGMVICFLLKGLCRGI